MKYAGWGGAGWFTVLQERHWSVENFHGGPSSVCKASLPYLLASGD